MWLRMFLGIALIAALGLPFFVMRDSMSPNVVVAPLKAPVVRNEPFLFAPLEDQGPEATRSREYSRVLPHEGVHPEPTDEPQANLPRMRAAPAPAPKAKETKPAPDKKAESLDSFKNGKLVLGKTIAVNGFHKGEPVLVLVDKGSHTTYVLQKQKGDRVVKVYSASNAIGTSDSPTPLGSFWVTDKTKWPSWIPPKSIDPKQKPVHPYNKDRKNPLGVARIRLNKWEISLHGTNNPASIRGNVSHGCIRHSNQDILKIFAMVQPGTPVKLIRNFNGTTLEKDDFNKRG